MIQPIRRLARYSLPAARRWSPWFAVLVGYLLSRWYFHAVKGVALDTSGLSWYWQFLDPSLLEADLAKSLWLLHSQPPGFNAFLGVVVKLFHEGPNRRAAFSVAYVIFGIVLHGALFSSLLTARVGRWYSVAWTLLFAFSPGSILYENWLFYSYPVAALVITAAALTGPASRGKSGALWGLGGVVALAALTRSSLHLLWVVSIAGVLLMGWPQHRRRFLFPAALAVALTLGLYAKNGILFGSFSASSWGGLSLSKLAVDQTPPAELDVLIAEGTVAPIARIMTFRDLDEYAPADRADPEALLPPTRHPSLDSILKSNGNRNVNHRGYVTVGRRYAEASWAMLRARPATYIMNWQRAWWTYANPVAEYWDLDLNRRRIATTHSLYNRYLYGVWGEWTPTVEPHFAFKVESLRTRFSIGWMALLLIALIWTPIRLLRDRVHRRAFDASTSLLVFAWCTIAFCAIVANSIEVGENHRIRFEVEPLIFLLVAATVDDLGRRLYRPRPG